MKISPASTGINENVPSWFDITFLTSFSPLGPFIDATNINLSTSLMVPEIVNLSSTVNVVLSSSALLISA